jgi:hypothetical protein
LAFASSVAPAIMIAVARSGNNNLCHIVTPDHGGRPVPQQWFFSKCTGHCQPNRTGKPQAPAV